MTDLWELWGARVKAAREAKGLTQRQLSAAAGVSQQLISNIEKAKNGGSHATRIRLAAALDEDVNLLFAYPTGAAA